MTRLKQAIKRLFGPALIKFDARVEAASFRASVRAIEETLLTQETHRRSHEARVSAVNEAFGSLGLTSAWLDEVNQVLDSVIAEQFRLQSQVDDLQRQLRTALSERVAANDDPWLLRANR